MKYAAVYCYPKFVQNFSKGLLVYTLWSRDDDSSTQTETKREGKF
jgi:hypothetical protein